MSKYMNERILKARVENPRGNASRNAISVSIKIPVIFARDMKISKEDRDVIVSYNEEKKEIKIKKCDKGEK